MNAHRAIINSLSFSNIVSMAYLEDLSDADLLVRPVEGANHIAWQLGHLIQAEHGMIGDAFPGSMPPLPEGFADRHHGETASSDDPNTFLSKAEYLKLFQEQREATLNVLESLSESDLDRPSPERYQRMWKTVGELFSMQGAHWLMHAGQWAVIRRKLGRSPLF